MQNNSQSKQILHNQCVMGFANILKHGGSYQINLNPSGAENYVKLTDGKLGRLDIGWTSSALKEYLGDFSCVNPISSTVMKGQLRQAHDHLQDTRNKKNAKYKGPLSEQHPNKHLRILPADTFGNFGSEIAEEIRGVASHVAARSNVIPVKVLCQKYEREMSCIILKGVAKLFLARMSLFRNENNPIFGQGGNIRDLEKVVEEEVYFGRYVGCG